MSPLHISSPNTPSRPAPAPNAASVERDAGGLEAFVDEAGVVGGGWVDEDHVVQRGAVVGGGDDPSHGVAGGLLLVGH